MSKKPTSPIDICNLALDYINQASISSIETPITNIELLFSRQYEQVKRLVLRSHTWNFAAERTLLPQLAEAPEFGYAAQYELPDDYIRILGLGERREPYGYDYQIEDGKVLTEQESPLKLRYIRDVNDVTKMDPLFIDVLALTLALKAGFEINASTQETQRIQALLDEAMNTAASVDGQESPIRRIERSRFLSARRTGRGGRGGRNDRIGKYY